MSVDFCYWGEHEVWERLTREEHRGRHLFWFEKDLFSQEWFENRMEEAVANVGPRYTPELRVDLPIAQVFDGLGRTAPFYTRAKELYGAIRRDYRKARSHKAVHAVQVPFDLLEGRMGFLPILSGIDEGDVCRIDWDTVADSASAGWDTAYRCLAALERAAKEEKARPRRGEKAASHAGPEDFGFERHHLRDLVQGLDRARNFAESGEARLSNVPALLLVGEAGTGKTHLFCDVLRQRVEARLPTVLLLGKHFLNDEPWAQFTRLLGLSCSRDEFLGALEACAQAHGARALVLIDALNEGKGRGIWRDHLAGILTTFSRFPWTSVGFSVRTSYETAVVPGGLVPDRLVRQVHLGFSDHEYEAAAKFFDYYGIEAPSIPILIPEFQNPLLLTLFCESLKNAGLTRIPPGVQGLTAIFEFFIDSVNEKLSREEHLDFDPHSRPVQKAAEALGDLMEPRRTRWVPRDEAKSAVDQILPSVSYERSLFRHLISEGVLGEDRFRTDDHEWREGIAFSYDRFADHLVVKRLLDKHLDPKSVSESFLVDQPLGSLIKDEFTCWQNQGLVEALSIQLPERVQMELADAAPRCAAFEPVRRALVESLIWRKPETITEATRTYINEHVLRYEATFVQFLNALLTVAPNPGHPYNAEFLHRHLMRFDLPERDSWWSTFLHHQYGERGAVDRLVRWAWEPKDRSRIADDGIRLYALALAWFLSTPNRYLRDRATKALVRLLTPRIHVLRRVLSDFQTANDPYVLERLYAVAYGCSMRSRHNEAIGQLAADVYEWVFKDGEPPPHILLRDYARGVIEVAVHRGVTLNIDRDLTTPPYRSEWPSFGIPSKEELERYGKWQKDMPDEEWARVHLYSSVMGFEDFARYVIDRRSAWSSCRLGEPRPPTRKETYDNFVASLTTRQGKAWNRYQDLCGQRLMYVLVRIGDPEGRHEELPRPQLTEDELESAIAAAEQEFRKTLGKRKLRLFQDSIVPYLNAPPGRPEHEFDLSLVQRWVMKRVLDLGWTVERFGRFDRHLSYGLRYGRSANKPERIGKKYQWIAYHECLARVSDNFELREEAWRDVTRPYEGPWQLGLRDIDPSCLLRTTQRDEWRPHSNTWWFPLSYDAWDSEADDVAWLKCSEDLPRIEPLLEVTDDENATRWILLDSFYKWEQATPPGEEPYEIPRREIWYMVKSYIVKRKDMDELFDWAKEQHWMGRWVPESRDLTDICLGEFFWAPAYNYQCTPYYGYEEWTRGRRDEIPRQVLVTAERYLSERGTFDCSIDETIGFYAPGKWIADRMDLRWNGVEGCFFGPDGTVVAFDPSVRTQGPSALLIGRDAFASFLEDNECDILWTILGEKRVLSPMLRRDEWKGQLELSGCFRLVNGHLQGSVHHRFVAP